MSEQAERIKVLVVDDEPNLRELVSGRLERNGYHVETAADGYEALRKVQSFEPKLVVLDLMLPKMDGYAVCRMLKSSSVSEHVKIIMFTARCAGDDRRRGQDCGADAYVTKPFLPEVLLGTIDELLHPEKYEKKEAAPAPGITHVDERGAAAPAPEARPAVAASSEEAAEEAAAAAIGLGEPTSGPVPPVEAPPVESRPQAAAPTPTVVAEPQPKADKPAAAAAPEPQQPAPAAKKTEEKPEPKKAGFFKRLFGRLFRKV